MASLRGLAIQGFRAFRLLGSADLELKAFFSPVLGLFGGVLGFRVEGAGVRLRQAVLNCE